MTLNEFIADWHSPSPTLLVHTSGSTGKPKPMLVEKRRMEASARMTCRFLNLKEGDTALLCMPLQYIAGKMVVVRSLVCGLRLVEVEPCGHPLRGLKEAPVFAAMVPMQVYNSMAVEEECALLRQIKHLIIGGGAVSAEMAAALKTFPNAVWSTYGMTETLSHIALRRLSGPDASSWYEPFASVNVSTTGEGCLIINAPDVCSSMLVTNDIAEIAPDGRHFRIRGRKDNVVCSGGIKMQIEEIEAKLQPVMDVPFMITKRPDAKFGETVVLLAEIKHDGIDALGENNALERKNALDERKALGGNETLGGKEAFGGNEALAGKEILEKIKAACKARLSKYEQPHVFIVLDRLPMTETGKPARSEAMEIAAYKGNQSP